MKLQIADLTIKFENDQKIDTSDEAFFPFLTDEDRVDIVLDFCSKSMQQDYTCTINDEGTKVTVRYRPELKERFRNLRGCMLHVPIEEVLLAHGRFILHSSYVVTKYGAILFSGNSGVGKSTQADLWEAYEGSQIINGDRSIVRKAEDGSWYAYGSPYAGSSQKYIQRKEKIAAIIFLEKGSENHIKEMNVGCAFRNLLFQISMNNREADMANQLFDLAERMIQEVPVYQLVCTPDQRAVDVVKKELERRSSNEIRE